MSRPSTGTSSRGKGRAWAARSPRLREATRVSRDRMPRTHSHQPPAHGHATRPTGASLTSCPHAPSTCSHSGLALGAPRWPPALRCSVAIHSGHGSSGSPVLSPSRWGGGGEAGEAGTHPRNFPKENHPSVLPDAAMRSRRCFWPVPTALPALALAPAPTFQTKSSPSHEPDPPPG